MPDHVVAWLRRLGARAASSNPAGPSSRTQDVSGSSLPALFGSFRPLPSESARHECRAGLGR
ncbi:hypothetical protein [Streptomyces sp. NPDC088762]|uniref:hypothetical protein n=1 Tax=Streptomyces sp. NPDC088762 TaxID=3365891 RepID=UPI00382ECCA7